MINVYVEGYDSQLKSMFSEEGYNLVDNILEANLLCVEGGADVSPELYGEENTQSVTDLSKDVETFGLMTMATKLNIPIVGICRGSQALCVFMGGRLKQHINGHGLPHTLTYNDRVYSVSSTHHQEAIPPGLGITERILRADDGTVEVSIYQNGNLGCQFHPEYYSKGHDCWELFFGLVEEVCLKK